MVDWLGSSGVVPPALVEVLTAAIDEYDGGVYALVEQGGPDGCGELRAG
jgi:hypothetical protein